MAIFSGKIVDAYYTDEAFSNVTVLYNYEKDGQTLTGQYNLVELSRHRSCHYRKV